MFCSIASARDKLGTHVNQPINNVLTIYEPQNTYRVRSCLRGEFHDFYIHVEQRERDKRDVNMFEHINTETSIQFTYIVECTCENIQQKPTLAIAVRIQYASLITYARALLVCEHMTHFFMVAMLPCDHSQGTCSCWSAITCAVCTAGGILLHSLCFGNLAIQCLQCWTKNIVLNCFCVRYVFKCMIHATRKT